MSCTTPNFLHPIVLALSLMASFALHPVAARQLLQMNFQDQSSSPQIGTPALDAPSLNKPSAALNFPAFQEPLLPPQFLPLLPFPSMPSVPSLPLPPPFPSFPAVPIPGFPSNVPPAFPIQPAKMTSEDPSMTPSMMKP